MKLEARVFPLLATRMDEFKTSLVGDHRAIQKSMDNMIDFVNKYDLENQEHPEQLQKVLEDVDKTVFDHLAAEEKTLEGSNMKKYWSLKDLEQFDFI